MRLKNEEVLYVSEHMSRAPDDTALEVKKQVDNCKKRLEKKLPTYLRYTAMKWEIFIIKVSKETFLFICTYNLIYRPWVVYSLRMNAAECTAACCSSARTVLFTSTNCVSFLHS